MAKLILRVFFDVGWFFIRTSRFDCEKQIEMVSVPHIIRIGDPDLPS
jgi:hypothetical protein